MNFDESKTIMYNFNIRDLTDDEYEKWYSYMDEDKKVRVSNFRFNENKKQTVAGEMLARKAIGEWCGVAPENISFGIKEHGKPYAKNLAVEFNVSHSEEMVVCTLGYKPVGIDIEKIRPIDLKIAKHICTEEELRFLFGCTPTEKDFSYTTNIDILTRFFKIWTAKEATAKCKGTGVADMKLTVPENVRTFTYDNYIVSIIRED